ncbi:hypothetical protein IAD21_00221 [Abditibacteriota bacterium]|nr:hypothetical protein IAD21_00221 [Abditibacteriota bacterium]
MCDSFYFEALSGENVYKKPVFCPRPYNFTLNFKKSRTLGAIMSLKPQRVKSVPRQTARVARAALPAPNLYLIWRDELGIVFRDEDFTHLYAREGQPALCPWRLALVTVMQFVENLSDRQAADAVRARLDWKYVLGLELTDPGFNHSVLCEFRERLTQGDAQSLLLNRLLEHLGEKNPLKVRGRQRTDSPHVLASIRVMNRLELVAETLRAALNEVATISPEWLQSVAPIDWYQRYSRQSEQSRLPKSQEARQQYARIVGQDGFLLLHLVEQQRPELNDLGQLVILSQVWQRHCPPQHQAQSHLDGLQSASERNL